MVRAVATRLQWAGTGIQMTGIQRQISIHQRHVLLEGMHFSVAARS